jgi:hypothetical protein
LLEAFWSDGAEQLAMASDASKHRALPHSADRRAEVIV